MLLFSCASVYKDAHPVIVTVIIIIIVAVSFLIACNVLSCVLEVLFILLHLI